MYIYYICIYIYVHIYVQLIRYFSIFLPKVPWKKKKSHEFLLPYGPKGPKRISPPFLFHQKKNVFLLWTNTVRGARRVRIHESITVRLMWWFRSDSRRWSASSGSPAPIFRIQEGTNVWYIYLPWMVIVFLVNVTVNIPWPWILWEDDCEEILADFRNSYIIVFVSETWLRFKLMIGNDMSLNVNMERRQWTLMVLGVAALQDASLQVCLVSLHA